MTGDQCRAKAAALELLVRDAPPTDHRRAFELQAAHLREIADEMDAYMEAPALT